MKKKVLMLFSLVFALAVLCFAPEVAKADGSADPVYVAQIDGGASYTSLRAAIVAATDNATIRVCTNCAIGGPEVSGGSSEIEVTKSITLDLNGCTITTITESEDYSHCFPYSAYVFMVKAGGHLTVTDSSLSGEGVIRRCDGSASCFYISGVGATLTLNSGTISSVIRPAGFFSSIYGGAVCISTNGKFEMTGGKISNCTISTNNSEEEIKGGAVYVNGTFDLSGGTIENCTITGSGEAYGGAVYVNDGTFAMSGGTISGCQANEGGAVYVAANQSFTMTGGTIGSCTATAHGGGVYANGTINLSGNVYIISNTNNGHADNIYCTGSNNFKIVGAITDSTSQIGINQDDIANGGMFGSVAEGITLNEYLDISCDGKSSYCHPLLVGTDFKWQFDHYSVSFDNQGHGATPGAIDVFHSYKVTKPSDPTESGFSFEGWYKEAACTNAWNFASDTVTAPVTLYAKWLRVVEIPTAEQGLVYSGSEQTGVPENDNYTITGNVATEAGTYTATVTLKEGCKWSDGTTAAKNISWTIGQRSTGNSNNSDGTYSGGGASAAPAKSQTDKKAEDKKTEDKKSDEKQDK